MCAFDLCKLFDLFLAYASYWVSNLCIRQECGKFLKLIRWPALGLETNALFIYKRIIQFEQKKLFLKSKFSFQNKSEKDLNHFIAGCFSKYVIIIQ